MVSNTTALDGIITATHTTDGFGTLTGLVPTNQINYANNNNIKPSLMIGNNFDGNVAQTLLESNANRQNLIDNIISVLSTNNYSGVNIDIEEIYSSDRNNYTSFIAQVSLCLKPLGYGVSVSVPAKTEDSPLDTWDYAYDYAGIAQYADYIMIMTYDEHYPNGSPGAIASIQWFTDVANYAITVIPADKIYLGLAAYGYDWSSYGTKAYSIDSCYSIATNNNAQIFWDNVSEAPYYSYTDANSVLHTVWFENAQSISYKLDLVDSLNIRGVAIWRLGLENPDYWSMIRSELR